MQYISQLNAYWNWVKLNDLPSRAGYLYFAILDCANTAGWKQEFNAPNSTLQAMAGLDKNGLTRYRNVLVQQGLIKYRTGSRGGSGRYEIVQLYEDGINLSIKKRNQIDTKSDTQTEPKAIPKPNQNRAHTQDKDKEKEKEYITCGDTPPTPSRGTAAKKGPESEELRRALKEFEQMRAKIKKPLTGNAKSRLMAKLAKLSADERIQAQILEQSVDHCWQDVYALKSEAAARQPAQQSSRSFDLDEIRDLIAQEARDTG